MKSILLLAVTLLIININPLEAQKAFKVFEKSKNAVGIIDKSGTQIIPTEFDQINYINKSYQCRKDIKLGVISSAGKVLVPIEFDSLLYSNCSKPKVYAASSEGKWMIYSGEGKKLTELEYDQVSAPSGNTMALRKKNKFLEFDLNNESYVKISEENFNNYELYFEECMDMSLTNGSSLAKLTSENGLYGYKKNDEWIIQPQYESLRKTIEDYWVGARQGKYGLISIDGEELTEFAYDNISTLMGYAILKKDQRYGVYDVNQRLVIVPITYDKIEFIE